MKKAVIVAVILALCVGLCIVINNGMNQKSAEEQMLGALLSHADQDYMSGIKNSMNQSQAKRNGDTYCSRCDKFIEGRVRICPTCGKYIK